MDVLKWLVCCCLSPGIILAINDTTYIHDGDKIEPDVNDISHKYAKNQNRKWSLRAQSGVWALVFQRFDLEYSVSCEHDFLQIEEISNSTTEDPIRPVRYCGELVPGPYISNRSRLDVRFVSDFIWENTGFLIKVLHSDNEVELRKKMKPFIEIAEKNRDKQRGDMSSKTVSVYSEHPLFYTLIGCSVAALIIFVCLLAYFVITLKKKETTLPLRAADSLYLQPIGGVPSNPRPNKGSNGVLGVQSGGFVCTIGKSGKRYSKDNKTTTNINNTAKKTKVSEVSHTHHNNLYVSGNLSNNR